MGHRGKAEEESFFFRTAGFCACADKESSVFTGKGRVDLHAGQARELILSPGTVVLPVAGLLERDEPHRSLAEEILAVDQLLDCGGKEREAGHNSAAVRRGLLPHFLRGGGGGTATH